MKEDKLEKYLYEEAYNFINKAKNATERKIYIKYYLDLAIGMGFDKGIKEFIKHRAKPVMAIGKDKSLKFENMEKATIALGISHHTILKSIRSKGKYLGKGMSWKYIKQ